MPADPSSADPLITEEPLSCGDARPTTTDVIRGAAIQAVLDNTEKITRAALDSVGIDIASETAGTARRRPGAPRGDT